MLRKPWVLPVLIVGTIAVVFGGYQVLEETWIASKHPEWMYYLHMLRGLFTSVLCAFIAGWYMFHNQPLSKNVGFSFTENAGDKRNHYRFNQWLIRMRWMVIPVALVMSFLATYEFQIIEQQALAPLFTIVLLLLVTNVVFELLVRRTEKRYLLLHAQIGSDLIFLTILLHFSGGIENPLSAMYLIHIILAGMLLDRKRCYGVAAISLALLGTEAMLVYNGVVGHYANWMTLHADTIASTVHASHSLPFVAGQLGTNALYFFLTSYFVNSIMDRLRSERQKKEKEHQNLINVLESTGAGLVVYDQTRTPVWMNKQMKEWTNDLYDGGSDEENVQTWLKKTGNALSGKEGKETERMVEDQQGRERIFHSTVTPLSTNNDNEEHFVEVVHEITYRKQVEAELAHAEKTNVIGELVGGIAHNIRNPASSLKTQLQLMKRKQDKEYWEKCLPKLEHHLNRIDRTVRGISQLSEPDGLEWQQLSLNELLKEALKILKLHSEASDRNIQTDLASDLPETSGNPNQIKQTIISIGMNAFEATERGDELQFQTSQNGTNNVCLTVKDTGEGIAVERQEKIFDPFYSTRENGMGMGLCLAQQFINSHDGTIDVKSEEGKGTIFSIKIPIRNKERSQ